MEGVMPRRRRKTAVIDVAHVLFRFYLLFFFYFFYRMRVDGAEHVRTLRRPVLMAANHRSFLDPPMLGCQMRYAVTYFARASLWKIPIVGHLLRLFNGIPVDRHKPSMDTMKQAVAVLSEGRASVLLFPEGTRSQTGRMLPLRQGAAMFARRAHVPVLPIYVQGARDIWPKGRLLPRLYGRLHIRFGAPMYFDASAGRRADRELAERLEQWFLDQEREMQR